MYRWVGPISRPAFGCAQASRAQGADLAITYQNTKAERSVRPVAEKLDAPRTSDAEDTVAYFVHHIRREFGGMTTMLVGAYGVSIPNTPIFGSRGSRCRA